MYPDTLIKIHTHKKVARRSFISSRHLTRCEQPQQIHLLQTTTQQMKLISFLKIKLKYLQWENRLTEKVINFLFSGDGSPLHHHQQPEPLIPRMVSVALISQDRTLLSSCLHKILTLSFIRHSRKSRLTRSVNIFQS